VHVIVAKGLAPVPTPVVSHAILTFEGAEGVKADGIVITPSHNPPDAGGFKYNPPHGGPADSSETDQIQALANRYLEGALKGVRRQGLAAARAGGLVEERDLVAPYVEDLGAVLDMEAIKAAGVRIGVDPLGGSSLGYWDPVADRWGLDITVVNRVVDATFGFMTLDHDGKIRMDCSSPYAMAGLIDLRADFDVAFGNDPDADRHGVVTPHGGLMNPNHYLAVAVEYLFSRRTGWPAAAQVGKTLVTSSMVDRVAASLGRQVAEVPVGFKWFVDGLLTGAYGFGGEESAGASFLRLDGGTWTTDKDGLILGLLAAEILAVTGEDPGRLYGRLEERFGAPAYARVDVPATAAQKAALKALKPSDVTSAELAGEKVQAVLTEAPANGEPLGGVKVATANGWFAARPSGTEDLYKIYAESFKGEDHLKQLQQEAQEVVAAAFERAGA
ncbi:MAG: phosphoglucomutase, alpha-D-glucose phosphate-specific, partial [Trueperaceae bacterium]